MAQAFQTENTASEITFLHKLRAVFVAKQEEKEGQNAQLTDLMGQINTLAKSEAKKSSTVDTISKLISFSAEKYSCYLCKQELEKSMAMKMTENFPVEANRAQYEARIKEQRDKLQMGLQSILANRCECGSLSYAVQLIDEQISLLEKQRKITEEVD